MNPADYLLSTTRLCLRPFNLEDAPHVQRLAGAPEVAATTLLIPHPYPDGAAEAWISAHDDARAAGRDYTFAVVQSSDNTLVGAVGLHRNAVHNRAEIGYWIGVPYWGKGYCTEAAAAVVAFGFETLGLNRIHACHFVNNPASGRVMQKLGMQREGTLRQDLLKNGEYIDHHVYAILRSEWEARG